eukprot:11220322-Lingulodinium_polyedra.AAC.1
MIFHVDWRTLFQDYHGVLDGGNDGDGDAAPAGSGELRGVGALPGPPPEGVGSDILIVDSCLEMLWCRYATQFLSTHMVGESQTRVFSVRPKLQAPSLLTGLTDLNDLANPETNPDH